MPQSSGRSPWRTRGARRDHSRWCLTWSGSSIAPRPIGAIPSTTGSSPRWNTQRPCNAVLAVDRHAKVVGVMASDHAPEGFLTSRMDFIGRARSLGTPRVLETLAFSEPRDTPAHPTMDPIGSLLIGMTVPAKGLSRIRLLMGFAKDRHRAGELVARHLQVGDPGSNRLPMPRETVHPIGHGEIPARSHAALHRVCGRRASARGPDAVHAKALRSHDEQRPGAGHRRDQPGAAYELERQFPAESPDARLVGYRHAGSPRGGVLPLRSRRRGVVLADLSPAQHCRRIA